MTAAWPCRCGLSGVTNLGTLGLCEAHYVELLGMFDPTVFSDNGRGLRVGIDRPEHGPGAVDLRCNWEPCGATWVGEIGEPCRWCRKRRQAREADLARPLRADEVDREVTDAA